MIQRFILLHLILFYCVIYSNAATPSNIVVTIKPLHGLVSSLCEGITIPHLLNEKGGSSHSLALTPSDIKHINKADLVVWVGPSYEVKMAKVFKKVVPSSSLFTGETVSSLTLYPQRTGNLFPSIGCCHHASHDDGSCHDTAYDGHFWLDINNALICIRALHAVMIDKWPEYSTKFNENLKKIEIKLTALQKELHDFLDPFKGFTFFIDHDALLYIEKTYGFDAKGALLDEPDMPPSTEHLESIKKALNTEKGRVFFYSAGEESPVIRTLVSHYGLKSAPLDYEGATIPPGVDAYENTLRHLVGQISAAFLSTQREHS